MPIHSWFPTLIYYQALSPNSLKQLNRDLLEESYRLRQVDRAGVRWCKRNYPGGYTSYASRDNLHLSSSTFMRLEKLISAHVRRYAKALDFDLQGNQLKMSDCWVNIMPERVQHGLHLHPLACISGTYYVHTPPGSSKIKFEDPRLSKFMAAPPKKSNKRSANKQYVEYPARAGHLVLFESWLRHEVSANPSKERVSVSFNYQWK